ncbi:MAG TPA: hypothetical protein PLN45_03365 [Exilispira sp.]|nr:hypothetical protein [Exilispira sp.]
MKVIVTLLISVSLVFFILPDLTSKTINSLAFKYQSFSDFLSISFLASFLASLILFFPYFKNSIHHFLSFCIFFIIIFSLLLTLSFTKIKVLKLNIAYNLINIFWLIYIGIFIFSTFYCIFFVKDLPLLPLIVLRINVFLIVLCYILQFAGNQKNLNLYQLLIFISSIISFSIITWVYKPIKKGPSY